MSKLIHYSSPAGSILLPQGYTRLAYIESTGTQWVDTGWKTTNKTEIYTEMYVDGNSSGTTTFPTLFGARNEFTYFNSSNSQSIIIRIWDGKGNYNYNFPFNCWNSIHKTPTQCWVNAQKRTNYTLSSFTHTQPTYIFANNSNGSVEYQAAIRCKFFRIWDDGNIKRDFVPVQTTVAVTSADGTSCPSGSIGLLDLVENKFYQNKGTGTFTAGPECPQGFPTSEYCQVEWLESTGTQYIQTDYYPTNNIQLQARVCRMGDINDYQQLFGCRGGGATVGLFLRRKNDTNCAYDFNSRGSFSKSVFPNDTFVDIDINKNVCKVNGTQVASVTASTFTTTTYPFLLFAHNNIGTPVDFLRGRVSRIKITDGSIQHDYISCYRRSDMKPGMYDLVGRQFYTNSGTGEFLLGPSITFGWGEVVNDGCTTGINLLEGKTNMAGKRCDEETQIPIYSSITNDNATWNSIQKVGKGGIFTLSFDAKADATNEAICYFFNNTSGLVQATRKKVNGGEWTNTVNDGMHIFSITTSWVRHTITWKFTDTGEDAYKTLIVCRSRANSTNAGKNIYVRNVKLQYGEVYPGSFTPLHAIPHNISTAGKLSSPYDQSIYTEPDGSKWIRIFHHADPTTYKFASTNPFTTCFKTDDRRWWAIPVCNDVKGSWELMCKEKGTSSDTERKFRWIQNTNPMDGDFASTTSSKITRNTSSGYMTNTYGGLYRFNNGCYIVANNGNNGNWFGAFGSWSVHDGGIPSFPGGATIKDGGYKDLYLRIPENQEQVFYLDSTGYIDAGQVGLESMFNTRQWTIAMWFNPSTLSSNAGFGANSNQLFVYRKEGDNNATHQLSIHLTKTKVGTSFWRDDHLFTIPNYTANKWYHLTVTQNGATQTVYINGVSIGTASKGALALQSESRMSFGYNPTRPSEAPRKFYGKIQDIQIWDEIKNPAELM